MEKAFCSLYDNIKYRISKKLYYNEAEIFKILYNSVKGLNYAKKRSIYHRGKYIFFLTFFLNKRFFYSSHLNMLNC